MEQGSGAVLVVDQTASVAVKQPDCLEDCETPEQLIVYIRRLEKTLRKQTKEAKEAKAALADALTVIKQQKNDIQNYMRYELASEERVCTGTVAETGDQWRASAK